MKTKRNICRKKLEPFKKCQDISYKDPMNCLDKWYNLDFVRDRPWRVIASEASKNFATLQPEFDVFFVTYFGRILNGELQDFQAGHRARILFTFISCLGFGQSFTRTKNTIGE